MKLLVAFAVAAVLATIYVAVVAVATDVPIGGTLLACPGRRGCRAWPYWCLRRRYSQRSETSSIWRHFRPPAPAVRI